MVSKRTVVYTSMNDLSMHGGMETMIPQEVRYLSEQGYEVHILSPSPKRSSRMIGIPGIHEAHYPAWFRRLPWLVKDFLTILWIWSYLHRLPKGIPILTVSFSVMDGAGPSLAKLFGKDIQVILRIVGPLSYETVHFAAVRKRRYRFYAKLFMLVEAFSYLVADRILPVSEFEEANIASYGIDTHKVKIIRCGIDQKRFDGRRDSTPLNISEAEGVMMFVGRMVEKNGPLVIADAVPIVLQRNPTSLFVFVGDGPLMGTLKNKLASEVASERVVFTGFRDDIPDLHSQADIYVGHVSSLVEGLGQTVFEAMMSGLPVVVGRDAISEKIVVDGTNGLLVPKDNPEALAQAIEMLLAGADLRSTLGRNARNTALNELSFNAMMNEVVSHL